MTIQSYTDLQTAVLNWLARDGDAALQARVGDFIALFEARIRRILRVHWMEERAIATLNGRTLSLPACFLEMRRLHLNASDGSVQVLQYLPPVALKNAKPAQLAAQPVYFTIIDQEIEFAPTPDSNYTIEMLFYQFTPLSTTAPSNWLLSYYPDIYLFGALVEAKSFIMDLTQAPLWQARLELALGELRIADQNARVATPLVATTDTMNP